jgi:hypothetical protein
MLVSSDPGCSYLWHVSCFQIFIDLRTFVCRFSDLSVPAFQHVLQASKGRFIECCRRWCDYCCNSHFLSSQLSGFFAQTYVLCLLSVSESLCVPAMGYSSIWTREPY